MRAVRKYNGFEGNVYGCLTILNKRNGHGTTFFALHTDGMIVSGEIDELCKGNFGHKWGRLVDGNPYLDYTDGTTELFDVRGRCFLMDTASHSKLKGKTYTVRTLKHNVTVMCNSDRSLLGNVLLGRPNANVLYRNGNHLDLRNQNLYVAGQEFGLVVPADILNGQTENILVRGVKVDEPVVSRHSKRAGLDLLADDIRAGKLDKPVCRAGFDTTPLVIDFENLIKPTGYEGYNLRLGVIICQYKKNMFFVRAEGLDGFHIKLFDIRELNNTYKVYSDVPPDAEMPAFHLKDGTSIVFNEKSYPIKIQTSAYERIKNGKILTNRSSSGVLHSVHYRYGTTCSLMDALGYPSRSTLKSDDYYDYRESNINFN